MSSSVASPQATVAAPSDEHVRELLQDSGLVRLDGIEVTSGRQSEMIAFDPSTHVPGAWHYRDGVGMIVLPSRELWFWVGPLQGNFEDVVNLIDNLRHKGRMRIPITTAMQVSGVLARFNNRDWNPC